MARETGGHPEPGGSGSPVGQGGAGKLTARPATRADIERWHPEASCSFRAWVCEVDGMPAGIIGLSLDRPAATLFSVTEEALVPHLRSLTVLRLIKQAQAACSDCRLPIFALVDPSEGYADTAPVILTRLGFSEVGEHDGSIIWRFT